MDIGVIGVGAVGLLWAQALHDKGNDRLVLIDPVPGAAARDWASAAELPLRGDVGALGAVDLLLVCVPGFAQPELIERIASAGTSIGVLVDFSTAPAEAKRHASEVLNAPYLDAAITGAVALSGVRTPLLLAGDLAEPVRELFARMQTPFQHLDDATAGDAVRVKLLRSVITKGIEALALEALPAARHYGVLDQLFAALEDIDHKPFSELLRTMVTTHPAQAARRQVEVREAAAQLADIGYPDTLTLEVAEAYSRSVDQLELDAKPSADTLDAALDWADRRRVVVDTGA